MKLVYFLLNIQNYIAPTLNNDAFILMCLICGAVLLHFYVMLLK